MKPWQIALSFWIGLMFLTAALLLPIFWDAGVYWYAGDELIHVDRFAPTVSVALGLLAFFCFFLPFLAIQDEEKKR